VSVARCVSRAQIGLQAPLVEIEVHLGSGLPSFSIVGLPAPAVKESKERVRAALVNARFEFPAGRITVNLAPADVPKDGGRFDLPIALGILVASGQLAPAGLERTELYGELGLGGELKPVRGLLLAASHAARAHHAMIVPQANAAEVTLPVESDVYPATHLLEVHGHLARRRLLPRCNPQRTLPPAAAAGAGATEARPDIADVRGQRRAKRALVIAAAGLREEPARAASAGSLAAARAGAGARGREYRRRERRRLRPGPLGNAPVSRATPHRVGARHHRRRSACPAGRGESRASRRPVSR
jgi:magnesium chelatase family protein